MKVIDNFSVIEHFMEFQKGSYYKFEALVRNTDGDNPLYEKGCSNTNKNILIKSWFVDSIEYYNKIKNEMKVLCDLTGARLYITLDRKSVNKTLIGLHKEFSEILYSQLNQDEPVTIKRLSKEFASKTSIIETSDKSNKTFMFDVDTKNEWIIQSLLSMLSSCKVKYTLLNTKKGYHVVINRSISTDKWRSILTSSLIENKDKYNREGLTFDFPVMDYISLKPNELGLVYMRVKEGIK